MTDQEIRKRALARRLLEIEDDRILSHIEGVLGGSRYVDFSPNEINVMEEELAAYLRGEHQGISWQELKEEIARKRSGK